MLKICINNYVHNKNLKHTLFIGFFFRLFLQIHISHIWTSLVFPYLLHKILSSPFSLFFPLISDSFRNLPDYLFLISWSPPYVPHYRASKLSCWLRYYFQCLLYLNLPLPSKPSQTRKVTCTCLTNQYTVQLTALSNIWLVHFTLILQQVLMAGVKYEYESFISCSRTMCSLILCVLWTLWV